MKKIKTAHGKKQKNATVYLETGKSSVAIAGYTKKELPEVTKKILKRKLK